MVGNIEIKGKRRECKRSEIGNNAKSGLVLNRSISDPYLSNVIKKYKLYRPILLIKRRKPHLPLYKNWEKRLLFDILFYYRRDYYG